MSREPEQVERALAAVKRTLDRLVSSSDSGPQQAAFEIARAQFAASVRASWPANLSAVAAAIDRALAQGGSSLAEDEREELRRAAAVLRAVVQR
jgi:hypothetical protein